MRNSPSIYHWFRWHHGTTTDPKWRVIAAKCGAPVSLVIAVWATLMEKASESSVRGTLEGWEPEEIAFVCDANAETVRAVYDAMQGRTLDGNTLISWSKRQPLREDGSAERSKAWREVKKQRTQTNAKERKRRIEKRREDTKYTADFVAFWEAYPKAVGKGAAWTAWSKISLPPLSEILVAVERQKGSPQWLKDSGQFIPNPATWLNQRRWEDRQPEPLSGRRMPDRPVPIC